MWKEQMVNNAKTFLEKKSKMRWCAPPDIKTDYILYSLGWCGAGIEINLTKGTELNFCCQFVATIYSGYTELSTYWAIAPSKYQMILVNNFYVYSQRWSDTNLCNLN